MNRGLVNGLFHALGSSRLQAGTVCDTCCEDSLERHASARSAAPIPKTSSIPTWSSRGAPISPRPTCISGRWSSTRKKQRALPVVVIDPRRTRSATAADLYLPIRIGTDAALALGVMHILVRDGLADRDYLAKHTLGFDKVETRHPAEVPAGAGRGDHRARRSPTSRSSRRCTATPRPPSSGSAKA